MEGSETSGICMRCWNLAYAVHVIYLTSMPVSTPNGPTHQQHTSEKSSIPAGVEARLGPCRLPDPYKLARNPAYFWPESGGREHLSRRILPHRVSSWLENSVLPPKKHALK